MDSAVVTGAGGFIGHHLVSYLKRRGYRVVGVDCKYLEYGTTDADEFLNLDLRSAEAARSGVADVQEVYALAAEDRTSRFSSAGLPSPVLRGTR
jgi:GDP-D-mannose 3', 5'-epimerase